jgi:HEAT repeat protein
MAKDSSLQWVTAPQILKVCKTLILLQILLSTNSEALAFINIRDSRATDSEVTLYISQLSNTDVRIRARAALRLGEIDLNSRENLKKRAVPDLIALLKDQDSEVRANAAVALRNISSEANTVVPALVNALKDQDAAVRSEVVSALGNMRDAASTELVNALTNALKDRDSTVRATAAEAIGNIGSVESIPALINALKDPDAEVRLSATRSFKMFNIKDNLDAINILSALIDSLSDKDANVRRSASDALISISASFLGDDGVRDEAAKSLVSARAEIPRLIKVLKTNQDAKVRANIALVIANIGGTEAKAAIPVLINLIKTDQDSEVGGWSAYALGRLDLENKEVISALIDALKIDTGKYNLAGANTPQNASNALGLLAEHFNDRKKELSDKDLTQSILTLEEVLNALNNRKGFFSEGEIARVSRSLEALKIERDSRLSVKITTTFGKYPWLPVIPAILLTYSIVFWLRPHWLLLIPTELTIPKAGIKVPVAALRWLKYRPRSLDAWVAAHISTARVNFTKLKTVQQRQTHIPFLAPNGKSYFEEMKTVFADKEFCLLIHGDGGIGKTSLACQIAQLAMSADEKQRLSTHVMIPVLLEQDFDPEVEKSKQLLSAIKGRLERLVESTETIPDELLDQLLRHRRLLVVIDHFSELSKDTQKAIKPDSPNFPIKALVVTSRIKEDLNHVQKQTIELPHISASAGQLTMFLESYLQAKQKNTLFSDPEAQIEFNNHCNRLIAMAGSKGITVLLAKLYAQLMIAQKEGKFMETLPTSIPDVMLSYINELNSGQLKLEFADYIVQQDAQMIAWECLKSTYRPTPIQRDTALSLLGSDNALARLLHLEKRLQLLQTVGFAQDQLRFVLDPLAEYLAGFHLVRVNGSDKTAWQDFFQHASEFKREEIQGFMQATQECCRVSGWNVPKEIVAQFAAFVTAS